MSRVVIKASSPPLSSPVTSRLSFLRPRIPCLRHNSTRSLSALRLSCKEGERYNHSLNEHQPFSKFYYCIYFVFCLHYEKTKDKQLVFGHDGTRRLGGNWRKQLLVAKEARRVYVLCLRVLWVTGCSQELINTKQHRRAWKLPCKC